jgi:hypothetical protein
LGRGSYGTNRLFWNSLLVSQQTLSNRFTGASHEYAQAHVPLLANRGKPVSNHFPLADHKEGGASDHHAPFVAKNWPQIVKWLRALRHSRWAGQFLAGESLPLSRAPQNLNWIDCQRTQARHHICRQRDEQEQRSHASKRRRIGCAHSEDKLLQYPADGYRSSNAQREADQRKLHTVAHNHLNNVVPLCAEREPHSDLGSPLRDRVSHHPVNANRRKKGTQSGEYGQQQKIEPLGSQSLLNV